MFSTKPKISTSFYTINNAPLAMNSFSASVPGFYAVETLNRNINAYYRLTVSEYENIGIKTADLQVSPAACPCRPFCGACENGIRECTSWLL